MDQSSYALVYIQTYSPIYRLLFKRFHFCFRAFFSGNNIWRISAWFSHAPPDDVTGESIRRLLNEQVLTEEQSSVAVTNGKLGDMGTIHYRVNVTRLTCPQILYMCVKFDTVDTPQIVSDQAFLLNSIPSSRRFTVCRVNWYCKRKLSVIKRRNLKKIQRKKCLERHH